MAVGSKGTWSALLNQPPSESPHWLVQLTPAQPSVELTPAQPAALTTDRKSVVVKNMILESIAWDRTPSSHISYAIWGFAGLMVERGAWPGKYFLSTGCTSITVRRQILAEVRPQE